MKKYILILFLFSGFTKFVVSQQNTEPDFNWGNAGYYNLNVGESIIYQGIEVKLLQLKNHYNLLEIGGDSVWLKVSRRTLPLTYNFLRVFVADNINLKQLAQNEKVHGLLQKDALICLSEYQAPLLDNRKFIFPVSFNDGFLWTASENSSMFSFVGTTARKEESFLWHPGIDIDLHDARGKEKHWLATMENSRVVWVENSAGKNQACVLLESESQPGIYYVYQHLYEKNIEVKPGQKLMRGEPLGTIWGDEEWGHLHLAVVKSDTVPTYENRFANCVNFFPQLFGLYHSEPYNYYPTFTKGRIYFGNPSSFHGNQKNVDAFEPHSGKGWRLGKWNITDKVGWATNQMDGNARLSKTLFSGTAAECKNPQDHYDFEINVKNGVYRIRAKLGDLKLPSWQKVLFENVNAATYSLAAAETKWTPEKVVRVTDRKLTIRIYVDEKNNQVAGLGEIVFQRAN